MSQGPGGTARRQGKPTQKENPGSEAATLPFGRSSEEEEEAGRVWRYVVWRVAVSDVCPTNRAAVTDEGGPGECSES